MNRYARIIIIFLGSVFLTTGAFAQRKVDARAVENVLLDAVQKMQDGDFKAARSRLEAIRKADPSNDAAVYYMGMLHLAEGDVAKAEECMTEAHRLDSANVWYTDALAQVYAREGKESSAIAIYKDLMERYPSRYRSPYVLTILGDEALSQRSDSLAQARYESALAMDPSYPPAVLGMAEVHRMKGRFPAFFTTLKSFCADPDVYSSAKVQYISALLKHVDGRFYSAWHAQLDTLVETCIRIHPNDSTVLKFGGEWYYGTDRKEKGRSLFDEWLRLYPQSIDAHEVHMQLCAMDDDWDTVIEECETLAAMTRGDKSRQVGYISNIGDVWHSRGNSKKAYAAYERALKLDPDYAPVLNNYAYYLSMEGRKLKKAASMSRKTVEKEPDNPTYLDTYAWILYLQGHPEKAKPYFKHAMIYGGKESAVVLEHYSIVLDALGEKDLAAYYHNLAEGKK